MLALHTHSFTLTPIIWQVVFNQIHLLEVLLNREDQVGIVEEIRL
jgi:hypothetical protein